MRVQGDSLGRRGCTAPADRDNGWFFDTELLVLAEHNGLRIHEVPVDWIDDTDSRVDIALTAREDLRGIWRLIRRFAQPRASRRILRVDCGRPRWLLARN